MGAFTFTEEFTSPVQAARLFKGLILDSDILIPKLMPQAVKSIETEGDGGPGSIKKMIILPGPDQQSCLKHRVDALDKEKMIYSYTLIEGPDLTDKLESISYEIKLETAPDGVSKGTKVSKYYPKPGVVINQEEIKLEKEKAMAVLKAVEAYLLAHPDA